jgi:hypothetical protein
MSARLTKFPKNSNRSVHGGTTIIGKNGLPVDALATLEPGLQLLAGPNLVSFSSPTVTVQGSVDLSVVSNHTVFLHTGIIIFTDSNKQSYFIDKNSIDNTAKTFDIYLDEELTQPVLNLPTTAWIISEAELVNRLQTTSTAVIDTVEFRGIDAKLSLSGADGDSFKLVDSQGDELLVEADGSINVNVQNISIDAADGDSVLITGTQDGTPTGTQNTAKITADKKLWVKAEDLELLLADIYSELQLKANTTDAQNIRNLNSLQDSVSVPGVATQAEQVLSNTFLASIETELQNLNSKKISGFPTLDPDSIQLVGSIDGTETGTKFGLVYNLRQQILAAHDREQEITYADFGTKNQRVTQIDYTSPTFPGVIARKELAYTLVGNRYRRDEITWSIV